jgi:hypothetical protein
VSIEESLPARLFPADDERILLLMRAPVRLGSNSAAPVAPDFLPATRKCRFFADAAMAGAVAPPT